MCVVPSPAGSLTCCLPALLRQVGLSPAHKRGHGILTVTVVRSAQVGRDHYLMAAHALTHWARADAVMPPACIDQLD